MNRRQFTGTLAGLAAALPARSAASDPAHWFLLETFQLRQGDQVTRMHDYLKAWLPKAPAGPKLILEAVIAPHTPQLLAIAGMANFEDLRTAQATVTSSLAALGLGDPVFDALNTTILEAAAYSPEIVAGKSDKLRYFELRTYHAPTMAQLIALHQRFAGPEVRVFHRSGIFPLFYASTLIGANMPNLTYLIPFDSLAAREKAWAAFAADPEWIKARQESIDKSGQIVSVSDIAIYRATPYSPIS
jgi:hypothetical protein